MPQGAGPRNRGSWGSGHRSHRRQGTSTGSSSCCCTPGCSARCREYPGSRGQLTSHVQQLRTITQLAWMQRTVSRMSRKPRVWPPLPYTVSGWPTAACTTKRFRAAGRGEGGGVCRLNRWALPAFALRVCFSRRRGRFWLQTLHLSLLFTLLTRAKDAVVVVAVDEGLVRHRLLRAHAVHHTLHKAKQQGCGTEQADRKHKGNCLLSPRCARRTPQPAIRGEDRSR